MNRSIELSGAPITTKSNFSKICGIRELMRYIKVSNITTKLIFSIFASRLIPPKLGKSIFILLKFKKFTFGRFLPLTFRSGKLKLPALGFGLSSGLIGSGFQPSGNSRSVLKSSPPRISGGGSTFNPPTLVGILKSPLGGSSILLIPPLPPTDGGSNPSPQLDPIQSAGGMNFGKLSNSLPFHPPILY